MESIKTVGIVGLGSFGQFLASLFSSEFDVIASSRTITHVDGARVVPLEEVVKADVVILGFPFHAYEPMLQKIAPLLAPETLVIDVCSVKVKPEQLLEHYLSAGQPILLTHPLFGPQSAATGTKDHRLIVTNEPTNDKAQAFLEFCEMQLQLRLSRMSSDEHDQIMARVHALTFFVARALGTMKLEEEEFMTPSYSELLDLVKLDALHSEELFQTVEGANPYACDMRAAFITAVQSVEKTVD